ncbi:hypothetical protein FOMA001_g18916 [Fusarium oxysporum f. sp. matthiolae]|nr:hypothetical protein FOMA001_g18916 [Fusarium oxysporum f. sp. matthiolae]
MTAQQQSLETLLGISSQRKSLKQQPDAAFIKAESGRTTLADLPTVQIGCKRYIPEEYIANKNRKGRRSWIQAYGFFLTEVSPDLRTLQTYWACSKCDERGKSSLFVATNTTSPIEHLRRSHMITEADGNAYEDSSRADSQPPSKRRCLELPTARSNVNKAKELTVGWIVTANLPFTAPSNPYLRRMLKGVLNSTYFNMLNGLTINLITWGFSLGSVPTRSMFAFFRDRDPAGRSEPEGMESTAPSTNDVDLLSSATLAVASLATPAPSLQEETPHEEVEHQYLWRCFPDYVWSQRVRDTPSWVWGFGYDVEDSSGSRRWVCRRCIQNKNPKPRSFAEKGIQNANAHLFKGHGIRAPPDKTKSAAEKKAEKLKAKDQRSIAEVMKLDTRLPREQDIANSLAKGFDRKHFQRLLLEWIIEENHAFSVCEQGRLRQIFEYLNPLVKITDANITRTTIRRKVLSAYEMHKDKVIAALKQSSGLIHVSFDGWKSGNRHSLYGIACFFRDENSQPRKLALGVPELRTRHFGHNIAAEILDVLDAYGIQDKIGYFTLDNAESNDKAMEVIGGELGFVGSTRRGRCFGHTLNLSAKALLFGHNVEAFEEQLSGEAALSEAEHTLWRRKGPVGKLHNLVVDVRRSDQLTYLLRSIQRSEFDLSSDPRIRARQPVDLIIDNDTRWLSQLYMIRRAIILRPFIEQLVLKHRQQWEQDNRSKRTGNLRKSAREPRICLEENQLTVNDWVVLEHLAKLLGFYEDAVKTLEGDGQQRKRKGGWVGSYGNVWEASFEIDRPIDLIDSINRFDIDIDRSIRAASRSISIDYKS